MGKPPPKQPKEKQRRLTHEELRFWEEVTRTDERLEHAGIDWDAVSDTVAHEKDMQQIMPEMQARHRPAPEQLAKLLTHTVVPAPATPSPQTPGKAGIDRQTERRLRQGKLPVEATLDLHGMARQEAHLVLQSFLLRGQAEGKRCLLVITGKGRLSKDGGVLRKALPQWLMLPPCREIVLSYSPARQADGGEGAFYILLRRRR